MNDTTKEQVEANYRQIKLDVVEIIEREKERIANDPELRHLVEKGGGKYLIPKIILPYIVLYFDVLNLSFSLSEHNMKVRGF